MLLTAPLARSWGLAFVLGVNAYGAQDLSWRAVTDQAVKQNAELTSALERLRASTYAERGAYSGFFPELNARLDYDYGASGSANASKSYDATLTASQNIFTGFRDRASVARARAHVLISEADLQAVKARVSFDLKSAYAGLLFAQRSVKLQQQIKQRRESNLKLVQLRFESGRENRGSLLLSQAYLKQAQYDALLAENNIQVYRAQLARVIGRDEELSITLVAEVPLEEPGSALDFKALARATPEYLKLAAQEDVASAEISLARAGFMPSLDLRATKGRSGQDWFPQNDRWSVGASITLPLFSGGKDYYATKSAAASFSAASAARMDVDREAVAALKQSHFGYVQAIEKLKVDESFREAALSRAEIARGKYNNGLMTFEDWDQIENDLIARERAVLQSQRDRTLAEASWQLQQGRGVIP